MEIVKVQTEWSYDSEYGYVKITVNEDWYNDTKELHLCVFHPEWWSNAEDTIKYYNEVIEAIKQLQKHYEKV